MDAMSNDVTPFAYRSLRTALLCCAVLMLLPSAARAGSGDDPSAMPTPPASLQTSVPTAADSSAGNGPFREEWVVPTAASADDEPPDRTARRTGAALQ